MQFVCAYFKHSAQHMPVEHHERWSWRYFKNFSNHYAYNNLMCPFSRLYVWMGWMCLLLSMALPPFVADAINLSLCRRRLRSKAIILGFLFHFFPRKRHGCWINIMTFMLVIFNQKSIFKLTNNIFYCYAKKILDRIIDVLHHQPRWFAKQQFFNHKTDSLCAVHLRRNEQTIFFVYSFAFHENAMAQLGLDDNETKFK